VYGNYQGNQSSQANLPSTFLSAPGSAPTSFLAAPHPDQWLMVRYKVALGMQYVSNGLDTYSTFGESEAAGTTIAVALSAGNLIAPGAVDTVAAGLETSFYFSNWISGGLDRAADYINPVKQ
jgi:hypothetical protein